MNDDAERDALAREIVCLMRDFSVEQTPAELMRRTGFPAEMPAGSRVYVPWIAGSRFAQTLRASVRLRELGMTPVPHLVARAIADLATLETMLAELRREAQVDHALLVAGSQRTPAGSLDSTLAALCGAAFERHGWHALGLAAHPEGNHAIDAATLALALREKNAYARTTTLEVRLVTQFCFAGAAIVAWERQARREGNLLPVHVGLAGLASLPTLLRYARSCGVGASIGTLARQAGRLVRLAAALAPGEIVVAVARARLDDPGSRFERFHFFPFGSLEATVAWAAALARGDFTLRHDAADLSV